MLLEGKDLEERLKSCTGWELIVMLRKHAGDASDDLRHASWCEKWEAVHNIVKQVEAISIVDDMIAVVIEIEELKREEMSKPRQTIGGLTREEHIAKRKQDAKDSD